jgi:hypothetical protein
MDVLRLIEQADEAGLIVTVDDDRLQVDGPRSAEPIVRQLADYKSEVIAVLTAKATKVGSVRALADDPVRAWRNGVVQFSPHRPIGDLSAADWATFIGDCQSFVAGEWAVKAAALGWDAHQLFGCHRDRPHILCWQGLL